MERKIMGIKVAIVGLGKIGFEYGLDELRVQPSSHAECFASLSEIDKIAMCDVDVNKLEKARLLYYIAQEALMEPKYLFYTDYHEMTRDFQPDIVSIATPTSTHKQIACDVAANPCVKTIFLEKPIAQSIQDAQYIINKCENNGIQLVVNYTRRWSTIYNRVSGQLRGGMGKMILMVGHHHGPLLRTGTHMLDLFDLLANSPVEDVQAFGEPRKNYLPANVGGFDDLNINGIINFKNGIEAILISGEQKPYLLFELDIFGEKGRIQILQNGILVKTYQSMPSLRYDGINELMESASYFDREDNPLLTAIKEVVAIADSETWIRERERAKDKTIYAHCRPACNGGDALKTLQTALALHYSAMNNHRVIHPEDVPKDYEVKTY